MRKIGIFYLQSFQLISNPICCCWISYWIVCEPRVVLKNANVSSYHKLRIATDTFLAIELRTHTYTLSHDANLCSDTFSCNFLLQFGVGLVNSELDQFTHTRRKPMNFHTNYRRKEETNESIHFVLLAARWFVFWSKWAQNMCLRYDDDDQWMNHRWVFLNIANVKKLDLSMALMAGFTYELVNLCAMHW